MSEAQIIGLAAANQFMLAELGRLEARLAATMVAFAMSVPFMPEKDLAGFLATLDATAVDPPIWVRDPAAFTAEFHRLVEVLVACSTVRAAPHGPPRKQHPGRASAPRSRRPDRE